MGIFRKIKLFLNNIDRYFFKGNISVGRKVKFYQKLRLTGNGTIKIGDNCFFGYRIGGRFHGGSCEIQTRTKYGVIQIGNNVAANNNLFISANKSVIIEDDVLIGERVTIMDHNGHSINPNERRSNSGTSKEIVIRKNVWIGNGVTILPGTEIGENSIVAVGSVVKGIFPANVIIQGNPAVVRNKIEVQIQAGERFA